MIEGVFVVGAGRAGRGLARAIRASGILLAGLHGRRAEKQPEAVTAGSLPPGLLGADCVMLAVRDAQLDQALREVLEARPRRGAAVFHLSGSAEPSMLGVLRERGFPCGTFHPLLPLAEPARAPGLFAAGWVGIDGDEAARAMAARLAVALGARTLGIPPGAKAAYHAAAVMASNLTVILAGEAERVMREIGVDGDAARGAVSTLFAAAAANVQADGVGALTGPLARGEVGTVRRHVEALRARPAALHIYIAASLAAVEPESEVAAVLRDAAPGPPA